MAENRAVNATIIFFGIITLAIVLREFQTFLRPLIIAYILTLLIVPLIDKSQKRKSTFWLAIFVTVIVLIGSVSLISLLIKNEVSEAANYERKVRQAVVNLQEVMSQVSLGGQSIDFSAIIDTDKASGTIMLIVTRLFQILGRIASELFLAIIFLIFLIPSHRKLIKQLRKKLEGSNKKRLTSALVEIERSIRTYLVTKSLVSAGTAAVSMFFLWLFGSELVFILGLLIFALNFIPNLGSIAAVIIALFVYLITFGVTLKLLWLALLLVSIQMIFGNYIEPRIAGKQLNLSPVIILLSLFTWYWVWGIAGMMLAVPLTSIIRIVLANVESTKEAARYLS